MVNEQQHEPARTTQSPERSSRRPPGLVLSVAFGVGVLALLIWQFAGVADDGLQFQVLNPDLGLIWKTIIVVLVGVSTVCSLVAWVRGEWTMPLAIANAAANWGAVAVIGALTVDGALFASTLPTQIGTTFETTTDVSGLTEPFLLIVAGVSIWDSVDGILRASRGRITVGSRPRR